MSKRMTESEVRHQLHLAREDLRKVTRAGEELARRLRDKQHEVDVLQAQVKMADRFIDALKGAAGR